MPPLPRLPLRRKRRNLKSNFAKEPLRNFIKLNHKEGDKMRWYNKQIKQPWLSIIWIVALLLIFAYGYALSRAI